MVCSDCQKIQLKKDFELSRFLGTWYEVLRSKNISFEKNDGVYDSYSLNKDSTVKILTGYYDSKKDEAVKFNATAGFNGPNGWAKFAWFIPSGDYRILDTDYNDYVIILSCNRFLCWKYEWVWIMSRQKTPPDSVIQKAFKILQGSFPHYTMNEFHKTVQGDSQKYPTEI